ncbi:hypothetical protein [Prolixibacter denitrificans]|nr:hypothetical protein [Prolixibacter denitrificans]PSK84656.1 hypothetical protein CLV93_102446 [Prolixibacter denitrificans]
MESPEEMIELLRGGFVNFGGSQSGFWHEALHSNAALFNRCLEAAFSDELPTAWRACYLIDNTTEKYPELLEPHIEKFCERLPSLSNSSQKRHFARMLTRCVIPEEWLGTVVNTCFEWLYSQEPAAVKVHCMQIIFHAGKKEPDLLQELKAIIEEQWEMESKGFRSRGGKLLAAIEDQRKMNGNS